MADWFAEIIIASKNFVPPPTTRGKLEELKSLGYAEIQKFSERKFIELRTSAVSRAEAETKIRGMCERLLVNSTIETFTFQIWSEEEYRERELGR